MSNFWAHALVKTLNDKNSHLISSNVAVVIKDKFPKARKHYLVLPMQNIPTIFDLKPQHLSLLDELQMLAFNIIEVTKQNLEEFKIGFHADPSMDRVHLHVISKDFVSDCLKHKKHWNSFNTAFFLPFQDVYDELKTNGFVKRFDKMELQQLLSSPLICNQCKYVPKNMPNLKAHLLVHLKNHPGEES